MILEGKPVANEIKSKLKKVKDGQSITLKVIAIGDNPSSKSYINGVKKSGLKVGITVDVLNLPLAVNTQKVIEEINILNQDSNVHGIMLQMPLPKSLDKEQIINTIDPTKDVDGLTDLNMGKVLKGKQDGLIPCTPAAIIKILDFYKIDLSGQDVVVIGRSNIVGKPISALLTNRGATVTLCHSRTKNLLEKTKLADIIIVAVGKKDFLTKEMVAKNSIVIDVGINVLDGKLYGDADFKNLEDKVKAITPVPNGIGVVTNTLLLMNTYEAYQFNGGQ